MDTIIDTRYLDVAFDQEAQYTFGNRGIGSLDVMAGSYGDVATVYPESDWPKIAKLLEDGKSSLDYCVTRIFDQQQESSCAGNALTQIHEIIQCFQFGVQNVTHLSAMSLYKRTALDGSDNGSTLSDNVEEAMKTGILPLDTPDNRKRFGNFVMENTGFKKPFPIGPRQDTANNFKVRELLEITNLAELVSAQFSGHPVYVGREGHSIVYVKPHYENGVLFNGYVNSWGESWGQGLGNFKSGFGFDSRRQMQRSVDAGAYTIRTVTMPSHITTLYPQGY